MVEEIEYVCGHIISEYFPDDLRSFIGNAKFLYRDIPCPNCQGKHKRQSINQHSTVRGSGRTKIKIKGKM